MALLTAQPIYKQYMSDGINNIADNASGVLPSDGTINTATPGNTPGIVAQNAPGVAAVKLVDPTIQQASLLVSDLSLPVPLSGNNCLQNDVSALLVSQQCLSVPTPATGAKASDGLSQAPQHE